MKNRIKTLTVLLCMAFVITGCGDKKENNNDSQSKPGEVIESRSDKKDNAKGQGESKKEMKKKVTKFSDTYLVEYNIPGAGMGTIYDCMSADVTIYKNHTVIVSMDTDGKPEVMHFELTDEKYAKLESIVNPQEISRLTIKEDRDVCDGNSSYLRVFDEDDNVISIGGYMPQGDRFREIRNAIKAELEEYNIRDAVNEYKIQMENEDQY